MPTSSSTEVNDHRAERTGSGVVVKPKGKDVQITTKRGGDPSIRGLTAVFTLPNPF